MENAKVFGLGVPMVGDLAAEAVGPLLGTALEMREFGKVNVIAVHNYFPHDRARNVLMEGALGSDCDYLFFVDADMVLPELSFAKLYREQVRTRAAVVSGYYYMRGYPYCSIWSRVENDTLAFVFATPDSEALELDCTGLGCCLIDLNFVRSRLRPPYFLIQHSVSADGTKSTIWEDSWFCTSVRRAGGKVIGIPSVRCGHLDCRVQINDSTADWLRADHCKKAVIK